MCLSITVEWSPHKLVLYGENDTLRAQSLSKDIQENLSSDTRKDSENKTFENVQPCLSVTLCAHRRADTAGGRYRLCGAWSAHRKCQERL